VSRDTVPRPAARYANIVRQLLARDGINRHIPNALYSDNRMPRGMAASAEKAERALMEAFRRRLRLAIKVKGGSQAKFARKCGIDPPRVTEWLMGEAPRSRNAKAGTRRNTERTPYLPSFAHLTKIAEECDVSLDWLLFGRDDKGSVVPLRGTRTTQKLADDLAAHAMAGLRERKLVLGSTTAAQINGELLLEDAVQSVVSYAERLRTLVDVMASAYFERSLLVKLVDDWTPARRRQAVKLLKNTEPAVLQVAELLEGPHYIDGSRIGSRPVRPPPR
jgi:transcriptional regulator with XRE-family HTH domain